MKILVTGGLGHIGSYLIRHLNDQLDVKEIVVVDSLMTQRYSSLFDLPGSPNVKFINSDVRELTSSTFSFLKEIDYVIHLAAMTDATHSLDYPMELSANNYGATNTIQMICAEFGIPLIFPSTTSIYNPNASNFMVDELNCDVYGNNPYAQTKIEEEKLLSRRGAELRYCALRLGTIFGVSPGMRFHTAVNKFCFQASMGESVGVWATALRQKRPYLSITDASRAISHVIKENMFTNQTYNVVTLNTTVEEILLQISEVAGRKLKIDLVDSKVMNALSYSVLSKKFQDTGFEFKGTLETGIRETMLLLQGLSHD